jgi:hypothetical protein
MPGYINFRLPPRVNAKGERYFDTLTVSFDASLISPDALVKIIADASGLRVQVVEP